ncbi:Phage-related lysozyme (muramidase), GH24 family [Novosphingobium sp. CF614]|uniref:lysozyme n=1 Tax=Novosphingobium sp. CF614 TaxID=1884364 RepID=UPI0008EE606B|nr:lysozyme [Novosphingobium sp. CF614]SFF74528.1 Phage-related lysozyme (muramidase), GH24 family [Novosphingobium sp. CF614]
MNKKPIFDAVREMLDRSFTQAEVIALDQAIDLAAASLPANTAPAPGPTSATTPSPAPPPTPTPTPTPGPTPTGWKLGAAGTKLIQKWEGCEKRRADGQFDAYPDPGSADGKPWTIGWGSTGPDVKKGVIWTQAQCDARFDQDMLKYVKQVVDVLGNAPTTQNQFDALVSFHYNTGAIGTATLTKLHKLGKFAEAQNEFGKWIYNNHKPMNGLKARRADEAKLYGTG